MKIFIVSSNELTKHQTLSPERVIIINSNITKLFPNGIKYGDDGLPTTSYKISAAVPLIEERLRVESILPECFVIKTFSAYWDGAKDISIHISFDLANL